MKLRYLFISVFCLIISINVKAQKDSVYTDLSGAVMAFTNVYHLSLSGQNLQYIPQSFGHLKNMQKLDLSDNYIKKLPSYIGKLKRLKTLDISSNKIKSLPKSFANLDSLEYLFCDESLSEDAIFYCPKAYVCYSIDFAKAHKVEIHKLHLMEEQYQTIPSYIIEMNNLTELNLSFNEIKSLPNSITKLSNLKILDLSFNEISSVNSEICKLKNLEVLDLSYNEISEIPESISCLTNLKELYLYDNKLDESEIASLQASLPNCEIFLLD